MSSVLDPAGSGAAEIARVFWLMAGAAAVIWLNPLQGNPAYESYCRALKDGLPFLHAFLPARNLQSLAQLSRELVPLCQNV